jgi:hypothetical protein
MFRNKSNMAQHFDKAKLLVTEMILVFVVGRGDIFWHDAIQKKKKETILHTLLEYVRQSRFKKCGTWRMNRHKMLSSF